MPRLNNCQHVLRELASERDSCGAGHKIGVNYDSAGRVKLRIQNGEAADVVVLQKPAAEELMAQGRIPPRGY